MGSESSGYLVILCGLFNMDRRIKQPKCHICNRPSDKNLSLNVNNENGRVTIDLCEKCYYRLPTDVTKQLFYNASNMNGEEVNEAILKALKDTPPRTNMNNGFCLQLDTCFKVYKSEDKMVNALRTLRGVKVLGKFLDGQKIS